MASKIAGIKKINILRSIVIINAILFIASIFISIFLLQRPILWFYFFCLFVGIYLLIKSKLYKTDSNCYLGFLLFFVGLFFLINNFVVFTTNFYLVTSAFCLASLITFIYYNQLFHLFVGVMLLFTMLIYYIYRQNIINIYIFFALILLIVFIFSFIYVKIKISKK